MNRTGIILLEGFLAACFCLGSVAKGQYIYWTNCGAKTIMRARPDGSRATVIARTTPVIPFGIDLDLVDGHIYVAGFDSASGSGSILRITLDGSNVENFLGGLDGARGVAVSSLERKLYFSVPGSPPGSIQRINFDGTELQILTEAELPQGVALDLAHGKVYWFDQRVLFRANLDGTGVERIHDVDSSAFGIALDVPSYELYTPSFGEIWRSNMDGTEIDPFLGSLENARDVAIDFRNGKIYWTGVAIGSPGPHDLGTLHRASLDGTNIEPLVSHTGGSWGIAFTGEPCDPKNDLSCDDENACTLDKCHTMTGHCSHIPNVNCDDGDACTLDLCNPATATCQHASVTCNDHGPCAVDSVCNSQVGCATSPVECVPGFGCVDGLCEPMCDFIGRGDERLDLYDFFVFQMCFTGAGGGDACGIMDVDGDQDLDLVDYDVFQQCFTGPNVGPP